MAFVSPITAALVAPYTHLLGAPIQRQHLFQCVHVQNKSVEIKIVVHQLLFCHVV